MRNSGSLILGVIFLVAGCKTASVTSSSTPTYEENLSVLRPEITLEEIEEDKKPEPVKVKETEFSNHIKTELDSVNRVIIERNKSMQYVDGYTIQVYTGSSRQEADRARSKVIDIDPLLEPKISYIQPNYKVKIGQYTDRLEAHKVFETIKKEFSQALLIPDRVSINHD